jgi:hypothetical protein
MGQLLVLKDSVEMVMLDLLLLVFQEELLVTSHMPMELLEKKVTFKKDSSQDTDKLVMLVCCIYYLDITFNNNLIFQGVTGPTSAHTTTIMTEDTGKYLSAPTNSGQYRMAGDAGVTGPTSAHTTTVMTEDTGKYLGASENTGQYRQTGDAGVLLYHIFNLVVEEKIHDWDPN